MSSEPVREGPAGATIRRMRTQSRQGLLILHQAGFLAAMVLLAALTGCIQKPATQRPVLHETRPEAPQKPPHYEPVPGQDAATIAKLRAAPPPPEPEVSQGTVPEGDERTLSAKGYVRVGSGYHSGAPTDANLWAIHEGRIVGADKVLLYPPNADELVATYFVRYRLPFGARFRSLTSDERRDLGSGGVQIGDVVGGTPAAAANLQKGDFVLKLNGNPVADRAAFQAMLSNNVGKRVTLTISRNGVIMSRLVRLGALASTAATADAHKK